MAGFLIIVGITGSLLAFNTELERIFAPQLFATPQPGIIPLDFATLANRVQSQIPEARVTGVVRTESDQVSVYFEPRIDPAIGRPYQLGFTEFYIDPWTGKELGRRNRGDLTQGWINVMPFIYKLHWMLALGPIGQWTMGIVALLWTLDCFNGFYLTLPRFKAGFWRNWKPAWLIKRNASFYRLNFDLHRAGSLWLWGMFFIFAWSSVMMNIRPVYESVTRTIFDYQPYLELRHVTPHEPNLDWKAALEAGRNLAEQQSRANDFVVRGSLGLVYFPSANTYIYEVRGSKDLFERAPKGGSTYVAFDGDSGALIELSQPTGEHTGNTIESWLYALHMARIFGLPYQIFVSALGGVIVLVSVTGVYIWWLKRRALQTIEARRKTVLGI
jgi:uncharacterized iron-regulated membrane protein